MEDIDIEILEARIKAVLDKVIPIYYEATAEHEADCQQKRAIKYYERDLLRIKLVTNQNLITEFETELD